MGKVLDMRQYYMLIAVIDGHESVRPFYCYTKYKSLQHFKEDPQIQENLTKEELKQIVQINHLTYEEFQKFFMEYTKMLKKEK